MKQEDEIFTDENLVLFFMALQGQAAFDFQRGGGLTSRSVGP